MKILNRIKAASAALRGVDLSVAQLDQIIDLGDFGKPTPSGVSVSESNGARCATAYACINILSRDKSALPLKLYERKAGGGRAEVTQHPVAQWIKRPNPLMTSTIYRRRGWASVHTYGNDYSEIVRDGLGGLTTWPLNAERMRVRVTDGVKTFEYTPTGEIQPRKLTSDQVLHNFGLSFDGFSGVSPIRWNMDAFGSTIALNEYGASYFTSPQPKTILTHPTGFDTEDDKTEFVNSWNKQFMGKRGLATVAVLPRGMDVAQTLKIPNNEAQFMETQRWNKEVLAQVFLVPLHRLNGLDRATFSNIEHQALEYLQYTLMPDLVSMEQAIEAAFLTPDERTQYYVKHNVDALLRGDFKTRMEGLSIAVHGGMNTVNEARARLDLESVPGGDESLVPLNLGPLSTMTGEPKAEPEEEEDEDQVQENMAAGLTPAEVRGSIGRRDTTQRYAGPIESVYARILQQDAKAIRAVSPQVLSRTAESFAEWLGKYTQAQNEKVAAALKPQFLALAVDIASQSALEIGLDTAGDVAQSVDDYATIAARNWGRSTTNQLSIVALKAEQAGENVAEAIEDRLVNWEDGGAGRSRSERWGQREAFLLSNITSRETFSANGYGLVWVTFGRSCPFCSAMRGKRVTKGQQFLGKTDFNPSGAKGPLKIKRNLMNPPLHKGCNCMLVPG